MELNEQWIPIIFESIQWVKEKMPPSKKELQLKISDLEEQVKILSYGNGMLIKNLEQIMTIIMSKLQEEHYVINADTIINIEENSGQVLMQKNNIQSQTMKIESAKSIFDNMDEEILQSRLMRPSERGDKNDNI